MHKILKMKAIRIIMPLAVTLDKYFLSVSKAIHEIIFQSIELISIRQSRAERLRGANR